MQGNSAAQGSIKLKAENLTRKFDRKPIFEDVSFTLTSGSSTAITGRNGSGKSTLIKIISNLLSQSSGELSLFDADKKVKRENVFKYIGFVSPYLNLYDEFTGYENLKIISDIRGSGHGNIDNVLKRVGLFPRKNDLLKIYSSGMKQRLKIAFSILHKPDVLLLDEPTSNLDIDGISIVDDIVKEYKQDRIVIIATNDAHERSLCENEINLNENISKRKEQ
ncbi:MAG: ABC transporter-like protein [Chlorobi bacterium OLB5]|nr:MAG: ABC transporter-like protein [Chlorobi bacterium OLB5]